MPRNAYFVYEDGSWKHRLTQEEFALFMPGASFEEFAKAQGGGSSDNKASPSEKTAVENAIKGHYGAIGAG